MVTTDESAFCQRCGDADLRLEQDSFVSFRGLTIRLPAGHVARVCQGCRQAHVGPDQAKTLSDQVDSDEIGFGRLGEPVLRGT